MKKILFGLWAIALIATGCSKDTQQQDPIPTEGDGVLAVRLVNAPSRVPTTRASALDLASYLTLAAEMDVKAYTIYVFDDAGILEKRVTVNNPADGEITHITGLTSTSVKTVAVIANNHEYVDVPTFVSNDYDEFNTTFMGITDQPSDPTATRHNGLVMTGQTENATIQPRLTTTIEVPIERVVAKVMLGKVSIDPSIDLDQLSDFDINGVSMQRVLSKSTIGPFDAEIKADDSAVVYIGGLVGSISNVGGGSMGDNSSYSGLRDMGGLLVQVLNGAIFAVQSTLTVVPGVVGSLLDIVEAIADPIGGAVLGAAVDIAVGTINGLLGDLIDTLLVGTVLEGVSDLLTFTLETGLVFKMDEYFYVTPNNPTMFTDSATDFKSTLLTLAVTYDGVKYYYPIEINSPDYVDVGDNTADGKYIERNTIYVVNLNIRSLMGNDDPDQPAKPGMLDVTVTPQNWRGPITQNVNW